MEHRISIVQTLGRLQSIVLVALAMFVPFASSATIVKALSFAVSEGLSSGEGAPMKAYMATNDVDFGAFDYTKGTGANYFIGSDFSQDGKNYNVTNLDYPIPGYMVFVWNSDRYELVDDPSLNKTNKCMAAAFRDEFGDTYVLVSMRDRTSVSAVKIYLDQLATKYSGAKFIVTYNARLGTANADTLNTSLTDSTSGPGMTCLGRTDVDGTAIGGAYMYPADVPKSRSVSLVPKLIKANGTGTIEYNGTLATLEFPTKCKVIFNDWDGTVLQTNVVVVGGKVIPPMLPDRGDCQFLGWDHPNYDFDCVLWSFTATALYDTPTLIVSGDPENLGTANPAYGITTDIETNGTSTASVTLPDVEPGATERLVCAGYMHCQITDVAAGAKTVVEEGSASSFEYTHVGLDEIVWRFAREWLVSVSSTEGGSVSVGDELVENAWVRDDATISITATPESGYVFNGWEGDTDGIEDITAHTIDLHVAAARSLRAKFSLSEVADPSVQYVSANRGDDEYDGYSTDKPKLTIQAAVDTLASSIGYGTVHVAPGRYETDTNPGVAITNAIVVLGDTGNPEDVVVHNTKTDNSDNAIVFRLNHPAAFVANLAIENGHRYWPQANPYGANVAIESAGGTVSNCIIRNGASTHFYPRGVGAWLNSEAALITHCVVTNNTSSGTGKQPTSFYSGLFVHVEKGTVANCLVANNTNTGGTGMVGDSREAATCGVAVLDGRLLNSTVVTNEARYTGGIYLGTKGYATNVVVAGCVNKCTYTNSQGAVAWADIGFKGTLANASHCASDGGEALTDNCIAGTAAEFFRSMETRDYRPALASPLINKGVTYEGIASFDLLCKKRVQGRAPDIGAYENAPRRLTIHIR